MVDICMQVSVTIFQSIEEDTNDSGSVADLSGQHFPSKLEPHLRSGSGSRRKNGFIYVYHCDQRRN